jgi:hypothetical protein
MYILQPNIHYNIYGPPSQEFFTNIDTVPTPTPLLYYDSAQKSPLFGNGAVVGEFHMARKVL